MGKDWINYEEHNRKNVNCLEKTNSRNMDVYNSTSKNSVGSKKHVKKKSVYYLRVYLNFHKLTSIYGRNVEENSSACEIS